jgi:hypothetical protein
MRPLYVGILFDVASAYFEEQDEIMSTKIEPVPEPETPRNKRPLSAEKNRAVVSSSGNSVPLSLDQLKPFLTESKSPRKCVGFARTVCSSSSLMDPTHIKSKLIDPKAVSLSHG